MAILHVGSQSLQKLDFSRDLDLVGDFKHSKPPIKPTCGFIFRRLDPHGNARRQQVLRCHRVWSGHSRTLGDRLCYFGGFNVAEANSNSALPLRTLPTSHLIPDRSNLAVAAVADFVGFTFASDLKTLNFVMSLGLHSSHFPRPYCFSISSIWDISVAIRSPLHMNPSFESSASLWIFSSVGKLGEGSCYFCS